jgi:hypothetical protein
MARADWKTLDEIGAELVKAAKELPKEDSRVAFARLMYLLSTPVGALPKSGAK